MTWRHAVILRPLPALLALLAAGPAFAGDGACPSMVVEASAALGARWPDLRQRVRDAFDARDDIDACARVALTLDGETIITVDVVLPDGRSTSRSVSRRDDVLPALEALLLLPWWEPAPRAGSAAPTVAVAPPARPPATSTRAAQADAGLTDSHHEAPGAWPADQPGRLRLELSVATSAHIGDGQTGVGFGALSVADVAGWLAGFEGRVDLYQYAAGPPAGAFELGVLAGRRLRSGTLALDLFLEPALALQGTTKSVKQAGSTASAVSTSNFGVAPRLRAGVRLHFRAHSTLRTFVGVDGDFGRAVAAGDPAATASSDLPPLPAWTLGLALGATVGTR